VDGQRGPDAGVRAGELLEDQAVRDVVGARAAVGLRDADPHEPELAEVCEHLGGKRVVAVPRLRVRGDLLVGEAPRQLADLLLLVGQVVQAHGVTAS
jgi:hypothetical protein